MIPAILTLNAGSSSFRFSVYTADPDKPRPLVHGHIERMNHNPKMTVTDADGNIIDNPFCTDGMGDSVDHEQAFISIWQCLESNDLGFEIQVVGHRVVHGGERSEAAVEIDDEVLKELHSLEPLVPLHQPSNLNTIEILKRLMPDLVQIACFDTAFHQGRDPVTYSFAIPRRFIKRGIKRYGFHGISYAYICRQLASDQVNLAGKKTVIAHLGSGCSLAAVENGKCINTTMGFSSLAGLPMGTRCGSIDPGVLLYMMREYDMGVEEMENVLYRESGLLGLSGISNDLRDLEISDKPRAKEAINFFVYRVAQSIASMAATLHGLDAIVFTAGIGENNAEFRRRVCEQCAWLGVVLNPQANAAGEHKISNYESRVDVRVIPTDEEFMIASYTADFIKK